MSEPQVEKIIIKHVSGLISDGVSVLTYALGVRSSPTKVLLQAVILNAMKCTNSYKETENKDWI